MQTLNWKFWFEEGQRVKANNLPYNRISGNYKALHKKGYYAMMSRWSYYCGWVGYSEIQPLPVSNR